MDIYLSHTSALEYWLLGHGRGSSSIQQRRRVVQLPPASPPRITPEEALFLQETMGLTAPFHVAVADDACRNKSRLFFAHLCRNLPISCSFVEVASGLRVACPELALLQSAPILQKPSLIKASFELCGTYQRGHLGGKTQYNQTPLSSAKAIASIRETCARMPGAGKLDDALRFIRDGSASPQETIHALLLGLPFPLGGAGLGVPLMNHEIVLSGEAARIAGKYSLRCDLYWPKWKYDAEFESYEHHSGREQLVSDSARRESLSLMGISVMTVTAAQTKRDSDLDVLAKSIAKGMGRTLRPRRQYKKERESLVSILRNDHPLAYDQSNSKSV